MRLLSILNGNFKYMLTEISLPNVTELTSTDREGVFVIEPLWPGYGQTVGNALRRVLLSSLPGAAITSLKFENVPHEFTTIAGVEEDVVQLILNLKQLRFRLEGDESVEVTLNVKGPKTVTARDFKKVARLEIANPDQVIAHLGGKHELNLAATVERGRGFRAVEHSAENQEIGRISIDAFFSPVKHVNFEVLHTRVGEVTNFDKLTITVETDGATTPKEALEESASILVSHFRLFAGQAPEVPEANAPRLRSKAKR